MVIQHNIPALNSHRYMGINNAKTASNLEKLSSGYKINRAADDAAGLAVSEKMRGQIRGLAMAEQNTEQGVNLIQTAEGALSETHDILQRMRELAVASSNGTLTDSDRVQYTEEFTALKEEIDRIASSTHYNGIKLLDGSLSKNVQSNITDTYGMVSSAIVGQGQLAGTSIVINTGTYAPATEVAAKTGVITIDANAIAALANGSTATLAIGSTNYTYSNTSGGSETAATVLTELESAINSKSDALYTATVSGTDLILTAKEAGANIIDGFATAISLTYSTGGAQTVTPALTTPGANKTVAPATLTGATIGGATASVIYNHDNKSFVLSDALGNSFTIAADKILLANQTATVRLTEGENLVFQIGANGGQDQRVNLAVTDMSSNSLGLKSGDTKSDGVTATAAEAATVATASIDTIENANKAIEIIHAATNQVSTQRAQLGALQNRMESALNSLGVSKENLTAAEATIRDTDMAKEMMEFTKNNILVQASQAMLAQANQLPQGVLQLLR